MKCWHPLGMWTAPRASSCATLTLFGSHHSTDTPRWKILKRSHPKWAVIVLTYIPENNPTLSSNFLFYFCCSLNYTLVLVRVLLKSVKYSWPDTDTSLSTYLWTLMCYVYIDFIGTEVSIADTQGRTRGPQAFDVFKWMLLLSLPNWHKEKLLY